MNNHEAPLPKINTPTPTPAPKESRLAPKIARLPKATRDMINIMLDEGLPYRVLIDELAETRGGITPQSLCAWLHSGYQDYLKNRQTIDVAKSEAEFAADLLRELGKMDAGVVQRACLTLANLQILKAMLDHGDEALRKMLHVKPASYLAMLNTVCHLAQAKLAQDKSPKVA